jgi:hypothetical protein
MISPPFFVKKEREGRAMVPATRDVAAPAAPRRGMSARFEKVPEGRKKPRLARLAWQRFCDGEQSRQTIEIAQSAVSGATHPRLRA